MQVCLKQLTAEQLLNKKIQIIKSTAEPFVQIYKEEKKKETNRSDTMKLL